MSSFRLANEWDHREKSANITHNMDWVLSQAPPQYPSTLRALIIDNANGPLAFLGAAFVFYTAAGDYAGQVTIGPVSKGSILYYDSLFQAGAELQAGQFSTILTFAVDPKTNITLNVNTSSLAAPAIFDTLRIYVLPGRASPVDVSIAAIGRNPA
jgi:hypothetical protein